VKRRVASLQTHLMVLTLGTLLPLIALGLLGTALIVEREHAVFIRGAEERTRAVLTAVDTELSGHLNTLRLLAESRNLEVYNLRPFYDEVMRTFPTQHSWVRVDLADLSGRRLLDSTHPFGTMIPDVVDRESFARGLQRAEPVVSNLFREQDEYHFAVRVPVFREGQMLFVLSAIVEPNAILTLLTHQRIPSDLVAVVLDNNHRIIARTLDFESSFGALAADSLREALAQSPEGWFKGHTREGLAVYTTYMQSDFSGWTVAFGTPVSMLEVGASRAQLAIAIGLLLATTIALLLGIFISRRISRPISALARTAMDIGAGRNFQPPDPGSVQEVHALRRALVKGAKAVREREETLLAADRAKDNFLAMLSHELRNPLSALSSAAQILQITNLQDEPSKLATDIIARQVKHMTRLVDDLLDVARVSTGKITLDLKPLDLAVSIKTAIQDLQAAGRLGEHDIRLDIESVWAKADPARIEQIVTNLVGNALKYTPVGGWITVRVRRLGDTAVLEVSDSGVGMAPELATRIFDLFVQGDQSLDRTSGGLGVGLTLVKRLVELHGGKIDVHSAGAGKGTQMIVTLPAIRSPVDSAYTASQQRARVEDITVLLVEDNKDARESLRDALSLYGYEVIEAANGDIGIDLAIRLKPQVVLVDIGLPGMDGFEVGRRLRALPHGHSMLLVAISGYSQPESMNRATEVGFDHFVTKPVAPDVLAKLLSRRRNRRDDLEATGSASESLKILH
jgi:signal transduction histidine kinase/CheY-like chemotaxis protein